VELRSLKSFVTVAECLSFSRGAERLGLSQSALSRQVQALEEELKVRLFDRLGRRVCLTPAGEDLVARAQTLLKDAQSFRSRAEDLSGTATGILRVGATPQTLESLVSRLLTRFCARCPRVSLELVEDGAASLLSQVERGLIHVAIAALPHGSVLRGRELFPLGVLAVVPRRHALARRQRVEIAELASERLLLLRKAFMTRQLFDGACQIVHVTPPAILESASPHALVALAEEGHGVAIIPSTVRLTSARHRALPLHLGDRQIGVMMSAIWDPRRYLPPAVGMFVEEAYRFTRRDYPGRSLHLGDLFDSSAATDTSTPSLRVNAAVSKHSRIGVRPRNLAPL
jgi:DNA-binding transcriptional LysR family regulator